MQAILDVALPFFGVIFCGYAARRFDVLGEAAMRGLNDFVFAFALPALIVLNVADAPLERLFDWRFLATYYGAAAAVAALAVASGARRGADLGTLGLRGYSAMLSNAGFMGIPLVVTAFGPEAALAPVLVVAFDNLVTTPLAVAALEAGAGRRSAAGGAPPSAWPRLRALAGLGANPLVLAVAAGVLVAVTGLPVPSPLRAFAELIGAAAAPCAAFALGGALFGVPAAGALGSGAAPIAALKLVLHPLLVWLLATRLFALDPDLAAVTVIVAALPTGAAAFVLAQRYDTFARGAPAAVLLTHAASFVTVSALLALFAAG